MTGLMSTDLEGAPSSSLGGATAGKARVIASAPGRCGLVGNPTDIYGGSVVSCSTQERATCTLYLEPKDIILTVSGQSQIIKTLSDLDFRGDYLDVARAVLRALEVDPQSTPPFRLDAVTEIPVQAGLAGSTAILATIVGCTLEHLKLRLNLYEIAELIRKIEHDILEIVCGFQDHYMVTFGGLNYLDFREKVSTVPQDSSTPYGTVEPLGGYLGGIPMLLAHTGVMHHSGSVHKSLRDRWIDGERDVVQAYIEIAKLARAGKKALLAQDWEALGDLMNRNHAMQRDLGGSGESNEKLIAAALRAGAVGAKLAGAGAGGTIIALYRDRDSLADALMAAGADSILYPEPCPGLTIEVPL